jgi:UDP-N-acetylmuramoyl-L-alanyl-D-glutamate--2,6-diaminopimelate ligase
VNDVILLAGKGHEPYQEIAGVRYPFDDVTAAKSALAIRRAGDFLMSSNSANGAVT